jgi:tungstate transport system substrate-binding protein
MLGRTALRLVFLAACFAILASALPAEAAERFVTVASTTSTEQSGLFKHLLPIFTQKTGIEVRVVAVGTGQAIRLAEKGDADVLFVHHRPSEEKFVAEGWGVKRFPVMYNDFIVVGPKADPARIKGLKDTAAAFGKIAAAKAPFASRADRSGTHLAELEFWKAAGVGVAAASGLWYRETGSGMGPTLNTAAGMDAYALADRGTWLNFANRRNLEIAVEGDPKLFNQYGVMLVNKAKHAHVKDKDGQAFVDWLVAPEGQKAIADYKINGQPLFFPNAGQPGV